ncbi:hypothetical protein ACG7TL_008218 [Trametes sanguinea]
MVLFDVLLETRPHLRQLHVSGSEYPSRFHDMLRAQPQLEDLLFHFSPRYNSADYLVPLAEEGGGTEQQFPPLADGALLPSLKALRLAASVFPPTLVTYAYPITTLMLLTPTHKQIIYALGLFSPTLISLSVWQPLSSHCPTRCFWPTSVLDGVRLPKLRILTVVQQCSYELRPHMERSDYPGIDAKSIMALRESCGMLETIIWGVEGFLLNSLYAGRESSNAPIQRYARLLIDTVPRIVRFAAYDALRGHNTVDGYIHGDIWTRASPHGDEPVNDVVDELVWENDAIASVKPDPGAGPRRALEFPANALYDPDYSPRGAVRCLIMASGHGQGRLAHGIQVGCIVSHRFSSPFSHSAPPCLVLDSAELNCPHPPPLLPLSPHLSSARLHRPSKSDAMRFPSLSCLPVLFLALCLLVAHSPVSALSIPPNLKSPPRVKSLRSRAPEKWTNAQRLAAGLPPRAPRTYKRATPTAANPLAPAPVKRTAPSPSPSPFAHARPAVNYSGRIVARHPGSDDVVGYLRALSSGVSLGSNESSTTVAFKTPGGNALFSISNGTSSDAEASSTQEASLIGASGTFALGAGSANAVTLETVKQTLLLGPSRDRPSFWFRSSTPYEHSGPGLLRAAPHARPALTGGESAIWTFDVSTQALTAHWVNPDGSHPKTRVAYNAHNGTLLLTGDVDAYNLAHADEPLSEVALYFESE